MCDFKPGDAVVCVDAASQWYDTGLIEDSVYTVHAIIGHVDHRGRVGVQLREIEAPSGFMGMKAFAHTRFRKVQRRDLSAWLKTAAKDTDHLDKTIPVKKRERA